MTKPKRKPPSSRLRKRGHDSLDVAEHPQSSVVRPNDQFELPFRIASASHGVNAGIRSRSNAPVSASEGFNINPLLPTPEFLQSPVFSDSRSVSVGAAGNVSSDLLLGSYTTASAPEGSNVNSRPRPPELLKPPVFYRSGSVFTDTAGSVNSNLPLRSYPATPAFQGLNPIPPSRFPGPPPSPVIFGRGSVSTDVTGTPVNTAEKATREEAEDSTGVEEIVELAKKLPILELVYLAEVVEIEVKARGIPQLRRPSYHANDRPPTKFNRARSGEMIERGRKMTERMAASNQEFAEIGRKRRRMREERMEGVRMLEEGLLKIRENGLTEQGHMGL